MSNYSRFERDIARFLERFPAIKKLSKFAYSRLAYLKNKKGYRYQSSFNLFCYKPNDHESFFGYYDKSPSNYKGWVIAHVVVAGTKDLPSEQKSIELVVFDAEKHPLLRVPVSAYNWQQGSRAHWLTENFFIFNDYDTVEKKYVARVFSVEPGQEVKRFEKPVQDSFNTDYFLSLNYQRLMALRPDYGYRNLPALDDKELSTLNEDGIWKVDYESGDFRLLVSLSQACCVRPLSEFKHAMHKFNHVMISPSGRQFIFIHRYLVGKRRNDRLFLSDINSGELKLLSDYGMISHCSWVDENTVLGYMRGPGGVDGYWFINLPSLMFEPFAHDSLCIYGDGHPHVNGNWFVTDTYPDKSRVQHLLLCNMKTGEVKELGSFFHGFEYYGETRCDLHPRFSPDGSAVFFDSVFTGQRQLYRMDLPQ